MKGIIELVKIVSLINSRILNRSTRALSAMGPYSGGSSKQISLATNFGIISQQKTIYLLIYLICSKINFVSINISLQILKL